MSMFGPPPEPKSQLGRHRLLSPTANLRVSPLCLGAMNFGEEWAQGMGSMTKDNAFDMLDLFKDQGGNFIDTANNYQHEQSEIWLGDWMKARKNRDELVLATKFTTGYKTGSAPHLIQSNFVGSGAKSLRHSLDASLAKLQTSFIDILYVHWYDGVSTAPELMQALNHEVAKGRVLYLGVSDTPAWFVARCNQYARDHALAPFVLYQGKYSAASRDMEREIIPMCINEGMGVAPWGALGGGNFKTAAQMEAVKSGKEQGRQFFSQTEADKKLSLALEKVANRHKTIITSVALAYAVAKYPYVFPIVGGRTVKHLEGNIAALELVLSKEEIEEIEAAHEFDVGFPHSLIGVHPSQNFLLNSAGHFDYVEDQKPIRFAEKTKEKA